MSAHQTTSGLNEPLPVPSLAEVSFSAPLSPVGSLCVLTDEPLFQTTGLRIAFTERTGGVSDAPYSSLNLGDHVNDDLAAVNANRSLLMNALGVSQDDERWLLNPNQVHGDVCLATGEALSSEGWAAFQSQARTGADGIVCAKTGLPVLLCFADCVPVIIAAPGGAFAIVHAGWRGAIADIPAKGLNMLCDLVGCLPSDCNVYIGPHIGACCYETSAEILDRFVAEFGKGCDAGARHLDLGFAVEQSVLRAGAEQHRVVDAGFCTSCNNDKFFSYRADDKVTGRHGAFAYKGVR